MSAARFTDWTHTRVVGTPAAAAPYIGEARKLLGFVWEEARRNRLGVHQVTRKLPDGAVIIAEKHGTIPRMTIIPPQSVSGGVKHIRLRAFVHSNERIVVIDLEDYLVTDTDIVCTDKRYEVLGSFAYGEDLTFMSSAPDGSHYKALGPVADSYFVMDYAVANAVTHFGLRDDIPIATHTFPAGGTTELLFNVVKSPTRDEIYSFDVVSRAVNKINPTTFEVLATVNGSHGEFSLDAEYFAVSNDGQFLYLPEKDVTTDVPYITVVDVGTFTAVTSIDLSLGYGSGITITNVVPSKNGKFMYVLGWIVEVEFPIPGLTDTGSFVAVIDTETNTVVNSRLYDVAAFYAAAPAKVSRDGKFLLCASPIEASTDESGNIRVIDTETLDIRFASYSAYNVWAFGLSLDNERYFIVGNVGGVAPPAPPHGNMVINVCSSKDDSTIQQIDLGVDAANAGATFIAMPLD